MNVNEDICSLLSCLIFVQYCFVWYIGVGILCQSMPTMSVLLRCELRLAEDRKNMGSFTVLSFTVSGSISHCHYQHCYLLLMQTLLFRLLASIG